MWCVNDKFPNNVCRLCANISDVLIPIFGADKERIDVKIKKCCLPVEVTEDDLKPKSICLDCASKLEIFTELIELCLAADAKFETILQNANSNQKAVETVLSQGDEEQVEDEAVKMATMTEAGIESLLAEQEKEQEQDEEQDDEPVGTQTEWIPEVPSHANPLNVQPDSGVLVLSKVDGSVGGHEEHILVMVELSSNCEQTTQQLSFGAPRYHIQNAMGKVPLHNCAENNQQTSVMYDMNMQHISSNGKTFASPFTANSQSVCPAKTNMFNCSDGRPSLTQVQVLTFSSGKDGVSAAGPAHLYATQPMTSVSKSEGLVDLVQTERTLFKDVSSAQRDDQPTKVDLSSDRVASVSSDTLHPQSVHSASTCDTAPCSSLVSAIPETGNATSIVPDSISTQMMSSIPSELPIEIPTSSEAVSAMNCDESQEVPNIEASVLAASSSVNMTDELGDDLSTNTSDDLCLAVGVSDSVSGSTPGVMPADISVSLPTQISGSQCPTISSVTNNCPSSVSIDLEAETHSSTCKLPRNNSPEVSGIASTLISRTVHADTQCDILAELSGEKQDISSGVCTVALESETVTSTHLMPSSITALPVSMDQPEDTAAASGTVSPLNHGSATTLPTSITDTFPVTESALLTEILLLPRPQQETTVEPLQASSSVPQSEAVSPCPAASDSLPALQSATPAQPVCSVQTSTVANSACRTNFSTISLVAPSSIPAPLPPPSAPVSVHNTSSVAASSIADPHTVFIATAAVPVTRSPTTSAVGSTKFQNGATEIFFIEEEDQTLATAMALTPVIEYKETDSEDNENASSRGGKFRCEMCERTFKRRAKLNEHMAVHRQERPYECDQCEKKFFQRWDLTLHKRLHTGLFQCEFCNKTFPVRGKLDRHRRTHTGEKPFVCSTCGKAFSDMRNLQSHRSTHSDERPHVCDTCGRAFRVRSHLIDHYKVHSKDTPFTCDTCGKSFKWKTNLNIHRNVHTGERFPCNLCGNEYIRRADLTKHRRSHGPASLTDTAVEAEEEAPPEGDGDSRSASCDYVCAVCCKSYSDQAVLQKHLRTHGEHRPFVCDICGKGFHFHWYLSSHKKVHLDSKTYTCRTCGKSFNKKNCLLSHTRCHAEQGL
ncbi:uncharacterized protein LOC126458205 isoform X1 [Schistocerca serialis cubense]|uniref:uncharacterized protein LOC126458205 isoform X1 n=1 Tax=Schistocerca serialis cubense TaxID=2023355 RepID=UPI00214E9375|nr:uncharacterized protein LOC126458205 isoform X1 [Schistocerca serialis cubense]